jgi:hypothetical protein
MARTRSLHHGRTDSLVAATLMVIVLLALGGPAGAYSVTGKVTKNGVALAGVTITPTPSGTPAVSGPDGGYTIPGLALRKTYTLTPSLSTYVFQPGYRTIYQNAELNLTGRDFDAGDAYEPDQDHTTANSIAPDGTKQDPTIHKPSCADWLKFSAAAGSMYEMVWGGPLDTTLTLYATDASTPLGSDHSGGGGATGLVQWQCSTTGTYYLRFTASGTATGAYQVSMVASHSISGQVLRGEDGLPGVTITASPSGAVATTDGMGRYKVSGLAGDTTYTLTPSLDTYVFEPDQRSVHIAASSVAAQDFSAGDGYEPDNGAATATTLPMDTPQRHTLHATADVDWLKPCEHREHRDLRAWRRDAATGGVGEPPDGVSRAPSPCTTRGQRQSAHSLCLRS